MSNAVTNLCRSIQVSPAQKAVLMALADRADDDGVAWPSVDFLSQWTCLGRSTVIRAIASLEDLKIVSVQRSDGHRNRFTITAPKAAEVDANPSQIGTPPAAGPVPERDPNPSRSDTPPVPDRDGTRPGAGPNTSIHINKTPGKTSRVRAASTFDPMSVELPGWLPPAVWSMWVKDRAERKKPVTEAAARLQMQGLEKARKAGHDPVLVVEKAIENGWQGLYPARDGSTIAGKGVARKSAGDWWSPAGFECEDEAKNSRCYAHTAHLFRNGQRVPDEVTA